MAGFVIVPPGETTAQAVNILENPPTQAAGGASGAYCGDIPGGVGLDPCAVSSSDSNFTNECSILAAQANELGVPGYLYAPVCFGGANANAAGAVATSAIAGATLTAVTTVQSAIKTGAEAVVGTVGTTIKNLFSWQLILVVVVIGLVVIKWRL